MAEACRGCVTAILETRAGDDVISRRVGTNC